MSRLHKKYLEGKTIWITGASSGLGKALALKAAQNGCKVIVSGRNMAMLRELQKSHPTSILILPFDLHSEEERKSAFTTLKEFTPKLDLFIYSAGLSQRCLALDTDLSTVKSIMEVNFFGAVHLSTELLKHGFLVDGGQIVIISSVTAYVGTPKRSTYAASKHALHGYFNCLRGELKARKIAITLLCPGYVETGIDTRSLKGDGSAQILPDANRPVGLSPEKFADLAMTPICRRKKESYIGGHEIFAIYLQRFFPSVVSRIIHRFEPKSNTEL